MEGLLLHRLTHVVLAHAEAIVVKGIVIRGLVAVALVVVVSLLLMEINVVLQHLQHLATSVGHFRW